MELHPDEAYYWVYSRFLDWGYFDHPPMVALFIKAGDNLFQNKLGLRFLTVICSTLSVYLLWQIVKKYAENAVLFILLFSCFVLFHMYGFITTPDSPLLLFSILFFYLYQRYSRKDSYTLAVLLAVVIACMMYSKYHGILVLFFTILSNFKLLKRPSFWLIVVVALAVYMPHILWQIDNGYPSVHYHLFDRSARPYKVNFTLEYILGQVLLAGPLIGWYFYAKGYKVKADDAFLRAIKFNCYGIFLFFLLSTFKGRVEAHWTMIAYPPLFILSYCYLSQLVVVPVWVRRLVLTSVALILLARIILLVPGPLADKLRPLREYSGSEVWARQIKEKSGDSYVVFNQGFQEPSKFNFYNRTLKGFACNSRYYRKNQYDIWPIEDSLRNKRVYYVIPYSHGEVPQDSFPTSKGMYYGRYLEEVRLYQKVNIVTELPEEDWKAGETVQVLLEIQNPYNEAISFSNEGERWNAFFEYTFVKDGVIGDFYPIPENMQLLRIPAKGNVTVPVSVKAPAEPGDYYLFFSIRTEPFPGARNSKMIKVEIE